MPSRFRSSKSVFLLTNTSLFIPNNKPHAMANPTFDLFIVSTNLFYRERKQFLSRGEAIFIVRKKNLIRPEALRSLVLPTFSSTFLLYISCFYLFILPFLHVKFCCPRNYFRFCVKKFVAGLVVMGFCSTFALAFQRCGAWFSI